MAAGGQVGRRPVRRDTCNRLTRFREELCVPRVRHRRPDLYLALPLAPARPGALATAAREGDWLPELASPGARRAADTAVQVRGRLRAGWGGPLAEALGPGLSGPPPRQRNQSVGWLFIMFLIPASCAWNLAVGSTLDVGKLTFTFVPG